MSSTSRPTHPHVYHVDISDAKPGYHYVLKALGKKHALTPHTAETRAKARQANPKLGKIADDRLTHFTATPVPMPTDCACRIHTMGVSSDGSGPPFVQSVKISIPPSGVQLNANEPLHYQIDYIATAQALLFHHADLMTPDPDVAAIVMEHMSEDTAPSTYQLIENLALQMRMAGPPDFNSGWANLVPMTTDKGTTAYFNQPTPDIMDQAGPAMTAVQISTKNDLRLQNKMWTQQVGVSVQPNIPPPGPMLAGRISTGEVGGDDWTAMLDVTGTVSGMLTSIKVLDPAKRQVSIHIENSYARYLGGYIQFLDSDGNAMSTPNWTPDTGGSFFTSELQYDNFRGLGAIAPILTIMAIPVASSPGVLDTTVTFPEGAVAAGIYGCGLGTGALDYPKANVYGGVMTGLANLAIPTFFLAFGVAGQTYKPLYDILGDPQVIAAAVALGVVFFGATFTVSGVVYKQMNWSALSTLSQIIFNKAMTKVLVWMEQDLAEGELEDEIPFAGWIMLTINIATGLAQIAETIVEVATSPWNIPNRIATSITSTITIKPDPRHNVFPQPPQGTQASYTVKMTYQNNQPTLAIPVTLPVGFKDTTLTSLFTNKLGGQVKFECDFYIGTWLAATASSGWLQNNEDNTANVTLMLFENPVPITADSIYKHTAILTYQNGAYQWTESPTPPITTIASLDTSQTGNGISELNGLTLSQRHNQIGYAWKAAGMGINDCTSGAGGIQLHALQNIDIPGMPLSDARFSACGYSLQSNIVYDHYPPKFLMQNGQWVIKNGKPVADPTDVDHGAYYIDPIPSPLMPEKGGGYHLRKIDLSPSTAPLNPPRPGRSCGRFPWAVDSLVIHPTGQVVAINRQYSKIMVTTLREAGLDDDQVPMALTFSGQGINFQGTNGRPGLLVNPISVSCTYDGTILILENLVNADITCSRVQAFDANGNPVNAFKDGSNQPSPFLQLPPGFAYLDLTVAGNHDLTYIYILYYSGSGDAPSDYKVAIYQCGTNAVKENPIVATPNTSVARIATDMWHTLYTLNWGMTTDDKGNLAGPKSGSTGPAGRTVPSISEWLPPAPKL